MSSYERTEPNFLNEEALLAGFRQGDPDSFRQIFEKMVRPLTYFAENIVFSPLDAEDIVANSFSKLYNARERMKSFEHVKRWLYVIARNESIDFLRHKCKHREGKSEISYLASEIEDHIETERVKAVVFQTILSEIEKLPIQRKRILKLYFFEHKTTVEIADMMGLNTQTVLNHKAKALEALRRKVPVSKISTLVVLLSLFCNEFGN